MKKRILSMLLVIAMLVSLGPVRVFAAPSLPQNRLLGDDPVIHQNPLYPDAVYTDELVIPEAPVTTQDVSTSDYKPLSTIAVEFREQMKINSSDIILHYHHVSNSSDIETVKEEINDAVEELFALAFTHTGDPKEGDYLRWRWLRYSVEWSGSYSGKDYYIDINYTMEYITTAAQESKVDSAVDDLLDELNLDRKTDYQKIRGIYDWLCNNVSFDYENQNDDSNYLKYTAYAALINGKAIAPGYALLLYRLALELGVDNRFILGLGNGDAHAWNIVELDNLYYNLDSTMDASNAEAGRDYEYFLLSDANFHDHTRSDDYTTSQFNRDYPMASQDYDPSDEPEPTEPKPTEPEPTEPEPTDPGAGNVIAKGKCGQNINWTLSDSGLLRVSGSGATYDYEEVEDIPWVSYIGDVKQIYIDSGITEIGQKTFAGLLNATSLSLPSSLVTIGDYSFMSLEKISTLNIPTNVKTIGKGAFCNWLSLRTVVIPSNVTTLDMLALSGCTALENVTLGSGLTKVSAGLFRDCTALRSITIPANIQDVQIEAFRDCTKLREITFEGHAPTFMDDVFLNVNATAYYPANDSTWTSSVRQNYGGSITWASYDNGGSDPTEPTEPVPGDVTWSLSSDGVLTISGNGPMPDFDDAYHGTFPKADVKHIVIKSGVTTVGKNAFFDLENVQSVSLPETITAIKWQAFAWNEKLTEIVIPNSVTTLEGYAFNGCGFTTVRVPAGVTDIKQGVFGNCDNLTDIYVDSGNSKFYSEDGVLFSYDGWLMQMPAGRSGRYNVPNGTYGLYSYAFNGCESITSVTLPASITVVSYGAFKDCVGLTEIFFTGDAPTFQDEEDNAAGSFRGVTATVYYPKNNGTWTRDVRQNYGGDLYWVAYDPNDPQTCGANLTWNLSGTTLTISGSGSMYNWDSDNPAPWYDSRLDITKVVINSGVTTIGNRAFAGLEKATSVSIPSTVTSLGEDAFFCCVKLTSVSLPDGLTSIGDSAFGSCNKLTSINIPGSVKVIGDMAFSYCDDLTSVTLHEGLEVIDMDAFLYCDHLPEITIPSTVHTINYSAFGDCTALTKITFLGDAPTFGQYVFDEVVATVYYPANNKTWTSDVRQDYGGTLTWVAQGGSQEPGGNIASGTCGANVSWVLSSSGVLTISGSGAMYDYEELEDSPWVSYWDETTRIVVESGVTTIGDQALAGFGLVTQISLPSTIKSIGTYAFVDCVSLTSLQIPSGVTTINDGAFAYCESLKSVTIPGTVRTFGVALFYECFSLTDVTLSEGLTQLCGGMFAYCTALTEITIPSSVTAIKASPFDGCTSLRKITFKGNAPSFASDAFKSVTATVYYPSGNSTWTSNVRQNYGGNITWVAYDPSTVDTRNPFTDVKKSDYYYDAVIWAVENGITAGTSATKFSPNATCTRGQVVTFLWRAAGQPDPNTKVNPFSDVKSSDYFYKAVLWAVEKGITSGTGNGKFSPNAPCTRAQVATFLWRAEGEPDASGTNPFSDVKSSEYYYKAVLWAVENGITAGTSATKFSPNAACTRGQIVTFLYRAEH